MARREPREGHVIPVAPAELVYNFGQSLNRMSLDLDRYLDRIGYTGTREPTAATLAALHRHHVRRIPFENLDVLLGRGIRIDPASIEDKLVRQRRGGYCFEQNGLLQAALSQLGFAVTPLLARVRWMLPPEEPTAATHMVLQVEIAGEVFIADVGFGGMSLDTPLRLELDRPQTGVSLEPRRLVERGPSLVHQALVDGKWLDVYQISREPTAPIDHEMGNWFTSTYPQSRFKQSLIAARLGASSRYTLLNREFAIRQADGQVTRRELETPEELLAVLAEHFGLHFPADTRFGEPGAPWPR